MRDAMYLLRVGAAAALLALGGAVGTSAIASADTDGDIQQGVERADGSTDWDDDLRLGLARETQFFDDELFDFFRIPEIKTKYVDDGDEDLLGLPRREKQDNDDELRERADNSHLVSRG